MIKDTQSRLNFFNNTYYEIQAIRYSFTGDDKTAIKKKVYKNIK